MNSCTKINFTYSVIPAYSCVRGELIRKVEIVTFKTSLTCFVYVALVSIITTKNYYKLRLKTTKDIFLQLWE